MANDFTSNYLEKRRKRIGTAAYAASRSSEKEEEKKPEKKVEEKTESKGNYTSNYLKAREKRTGGTLPSAKSTAQNTVREESRGSATLNNLDNMGSNRVADLKKRLEEARQKEIEASRAQVQAASELRKTKDGNKARELAAAVQAASDEYNAIKRELDMYEYIDDYKGKVYEDDFRGQFGANRTLGRLSQDTSAAYNEYWQNPTDENRAYAEAMDMLTEYFQQQNAEALDDENAKATWITKSAAQYLPQWWDQTKATVAGGAAGALAGAGIGFAAGGIGAIPGAIKGAQVGATAASGLQSYGQMRGAAFRELLAAGVDEETARAASNDEGVISGLIEMGDTALTVFTLGTGKLLTALGKGGVKAVAGEAAESGAKRLLKALGKYGVLNIGQEMLEEGTQQAVSIANQDRDNTGKWDLVKESAGTAWDAITGEDKDARAEIWDAAKEGGKIAAMFGGVQRVGDLAIETGIRSHIGKKYAAMGGDTVQALIDSGLESAEGTESRRLAEKLDEKAKAGKTISNVEIGALQQANVKAIEAEETAQQIQAPVESTESAQETLENLARETVAQRENAQQAQPVQRETVTERTTVPFNVMAEDNPVRQQKIAESKNLERKLGYGEEGMKTFNQILESGNKTVDQVRQEFQAAYEAGKVDLPRAKVGMLDNVRESAYNAGRLDYIQTLKTDKVKAQNVTISRKSGFDPADMSTDTLPQGVKPAARPSDVTDFQVKTVDALAKKLGVNVRIVTGIKGNAEIRGNQVLINAEFNRKQAGQNRSIVFYAAHEIGMHRLMKLAPEQGRAFINAIIRDANANLPSHMTTDTEQRQADYAEQNVHLSIDEAMEEVAADKIMELYDNEEAFAEAIDRIVNGKDEQAKQGVKQYKNALDFIVQKLKEIVAKLKGQEKVEAQRTLSEVEQLRDMYERALKAAMDKAKDIQATKNATQEGDVVQFSLKTVNGKQVVWIENSALTNKQLSDHIAVASYIAQHIGEVYTIIESGQKVYIGKDLPGEYTQSKYTSYLRQRNRQLLKAKNKAVSDLGMMIETATNRRWEKTEHTQSKDAKYGMYRYDSAFAFPVKNADGTVASIRAYDVELLIRNASDGKKYLYDIVNIKENTTDALDLQKRETRKGSYEAAAHGSASFESVAQQEENVKYSLVTDKETLDFLNGQKLVKVYRAMQEIDGKLYPPMAALIKSESGKKQLVEDTKKGAWYQADEHPELIKLDKNGKPKFELNKGNGGMVPAAYNPYFHTSASPLNDQFSSAYDRPNIVIVEGYIPESELTSGYKAQYAKDSVGETAWHAGPVASKLKGAKARRVFLSRWFKAERVVPVDEVAKTIAKTLQGENVSVPWNVVTPSLREALEKQGVEIDYKDVKMGNKVVSFDSTQYSLKGERANLSAEDRTNLQTAKQMKEDGKSNEEIYKATGWYTQSDGKWRSEIQDEIMVPKNFSRTGLQSVKDATAEKRLAKAESALRAGTIDEETYEELVEFAEKGRKQDYTFAKLPDFLDAPKLYEAYPQLKKVSLRFEKLSGMQGYTDTGLNLIVLDPDGLHDAGQTVREGLAHEIQHIIQSIEGFARGSTPAEAGSYEAYRKAGGEIEARDVESRLRMTPEERRATMPAQFSLKDSEGRELSEGQREYFKDSKARDTQGNLLTLYHGTRKGGFTTFRDWTYLTASESYAKRYADKDTGETMYEVYANITKPFDTRLKECRNLWRNEFFGNYSRTELQENGLPDWTDGYDLAEWIEENDYDFDAILLDEGADIDHNGNVKERGISYVVRSSEQIKNVDNLNPTGDRDIRFSLKDEDYLAAVNRGDTETVQKMVDAAATAAGYKGAYYHGSRSDFTVFSKAEGGQSNSDASIGFWFTESAEGAKKWADETWYGDREDGKVYKTYLDLKNPKVYETVDNKAKIEELYKGYEDIDKEMSLYDSIYYFEDGRRYHHERYDYDKEKRRRSGISEWDAFKAIVKKWDADTVAYYLDQVPEADRQIVQKDAQRYLDLSKERKALEKKISELRYSDAYELYRTDIYKLAGMSAEDANIGGTGMYIDNKRDVMQRFLEGLKSEGHDGIIIKNTSYDSEIFGGVNNQYVVFEPSQIKSADPVTYDNAGKIIPLSERFSKENEDIRFSLKGQDDLLKQNAKLKEVNQELRDQFKTTKFAKVDKKALRQFAKQLLKDYQSGADIDETRDTLDSVFTYIANGENGESAVWEVAYERAYDAAVSILSNSSTLNDELFQAYKGMREDIKTTGITINKMYDHDLIGYESINEFRRANFGRIKLVNDGIPVDVFYEGLAYSYPEFFDSDTYMTQADQLSHIEEVLNNLQPTEVNPYSRNMREAATWLANDIMERYFELPQAKPTFADKAERKLTKQVIKDAEKLERLREQKNERIAELIEERREKVKEVTRKEKEKRDQKIREVKEHYREKESKSSESRKAKILRERIIRHTQEMSQTLLRPSDKRHIPESLRAPVAAVLDAINLESQYTIDPATGKRQKNVPGDPTKRTLAFTDLRKAYQNIIQDDGADITVDPAMEAMLDLVIDLRDVKLADMNMSQLKTVWDVVRVVEHTINNAGRLLSESKYERTIEWADAMAKDTETRRSKRGGKAEAFRIDMENPYTFFSHYGESGKAIFRMLRDAQDKQQMMVEEVREKVQAIVNPKTVRKLENEVHTFTTEGGDKLTLTTAQAMDIYLLTKRQQAHEHLMRGGIVQPEVKSKKIKRGTDAILLSANDLSAIVGKLDAKQREIADKLQELTRTTLADYGNEASMKAYGYKKFTGNDYWPIKSAREGIHSNVEKGGNNTRSIKNIGLAKTVMPHANNPLDIGGVFQTFASHAGDMTDYAAWLCPMEDANRLFNFQFRDELGNRTGKTIKGLLDRVGGKGSQQYWHNLMEDIQNGIKSQNDTSIMGAIGRIYGNTKGASVAWNIRVIVQQPTAIVRAAAFVNPDAIIRGLFAGGGWKAALKHSPIAQRKDMGGFDISSPMQMNEVLFDSKTGLQRFNEVGMAGAAWADRVTWGRIWNFCEQEVRLDRTELTPRSDEFYEAVNELFTEVVDQSQVVDGVLQRAQIMRSNNALANQATSFMGEPMMAMNMLLRAYDGLVNETNKSKRAKAFKTFGRAAVVLLVTNVVNALAQSLVDAARDDEDDEYWEKFLTAFTGVTGEEKTTKDKVKNAALEGNLIGGINPIGYIPFVKDLLSIMSGYSVQRADAAIMEDILQAGTAFFGSWFGEGNKTKVNTLWNLAKQVGKVWGIGAGNLTRDVYAALRTAALETGNIPAQYELEKWIYKNSNEKNDARFVDILYKAYQTDKDVYEHIYNDLTAAGMDAKSIKDKMESHMKKDQGVTKVEDLENRYLHPDEQRTYDSKLKSVSNSSLWRSASTKQKEEVEAQLYNLTVGNDDGVKLKEKISDGKAYGLSETEYLLYELALDMVDQPNKSGKLGGTPTNEEKAAAIDKMSNLGNGEIAFLWDSKEGYEAYAAGLDMRTYVERVGDGQNVDVEKMVGAMDEGMSEDDYYDFLDMLEEVDQPTESGKLGTFTQDEAKAAISAMPGLTREQRAWLWQSVNKGWKDKNNPWK